MMGNGDKVNTEEATGRRVRGGIPHVSLSLAGRLTAQIEGFYIRESGREYGRGGRFISSYPRLPYFPLT